MKRIKKIYLVRNEKFSSLYRAIPRPHCVANLALFFTIFFALEKILKVGSAPLLIISIILSNRIVSVCVVVFKKSVRMIHERERILSATLSHAAIGIIHLSPTGMILMVNPFFTELLGYSEEELLSTQIRDFTHSQDLDKTNSAIANMMSGASSHYEGENRYIKKDGSAFWAQFTIRLIRNKKSKPKYFVTVVRDISERKEYEKVIDDQKEKLIHNSKMSALGIMSAEIAHEINTPLMIIQMVVGQLRDLAIEGNTCNETLTEIADKIDTTCARITKTVRSLRKFTHNSEQDAFHMTSVGSILSDTLQLCNERLRNQEIQLISESSSELPNIECRPVQVSQVILNLLNNSIDAIQNLKEKWIHVSVSETEKDVRITIKDSGKGINPELREKILLPFFTTKQFGKGTGLGLSISTEIMKSHKGSLVLDSSCLNTCFIVTLPKDQTSEISMAS